MAKIPLDKETKRAITEAKTMIQAAVQADLSEADTAMRVARIFENLMGYDVLKHITREFAVHGVGDADYCDFAIQIEEGKKVPTVLIEIKKANTELNVRHLKQASSYAINYGCEWAILTNGKTWQLYHITFGQPPQTNMLDSWDLVDDSPEMVADKFNQIGFKNVKKGGLKTIWEKSNVLTTNNVLKMLLSEASISMVRRGIKQNTDVNVTPEEVVGAIRHLLNEAAAFEMDTIKICLPTKKPTKKTAAIANACGEPTPPPESPTPSVNPLIIP